MKKVLALLLVAVLLLAVQLTSALAADVQPGDTVTITVAIASNPNDAASATVTFDYDSSVFTAKQNKGMFISIPNAVQEVGTTIKCSFTVKADAKPGTYTIGVKHEKALNLDRNEVSGVTYTVTGNIVTIPEPECEHASTSEKVAKEPTCTEAGEKQTVCDACGAVIKTEAIEALGHDWGDWEVTKAAKVGEEGEETRTCKRCEEKETRKIDALDADWDEGKVTTEATCEKPGVKTYTSKTDPSLTKTEEIPALGHKWDEGKVTTEPTCEAKGVKTFTCQNDPEHTKTEDVDPLGHKWDEGKITTPATCEAKGVKTFTCQNDPEHTKTEDVDPLGHKWDNGKVTKEATCTEKGEKLFTCQNDSEHTKTEEIAALGHDSGSWVVVREASEEADGLAQLICGRCGAVLDEQVIPFKREDWHMNQTVSTLGIRFRDIQSSLTDKWYMFTPLDLSQDGVTDLDLIAANATIVGHVTVTVREGKVTVSYRAPYTLEIRDIGFALIPDLASVTDVEGMDRSAYAFDQEIDIENDLGGDTKVLLSVLGHVNFDAADERYQAFGRYAQAYKDQVEALKAIMD